MTMLLRKNVVGFDANGKCSTCGKEGEVIQGVCSPCSAKACYDKHCYGASCELNLHKINVGDYYLPCLKAPICKAIKAGRKDWREVPALDEVPYNGRKVSDPIKSKLNHKHMELVATTPLGVQEALLRQTVASTEVYATDILIYLNSDMLHKLEKGDIEYIDIYFERMGVKWLVGDRKPPEHYRCAMKLVRGLSEWDDPQTELYKTAGNV